jgi:hypothetical protein
MKKNFFSTGLFVLLCSIALAQKPVRFVAEASSDSVLMGHYFEVSFLLENANARNFSMPTLDPALELLSGPNTSSSFSMVNGESTQKVRYSFVVRPAREGFFTIPPASIEADGKRIETESVEIYVGPNPEGLPQPEVEKSPSPFRMDFGDFFGRKAPSFPSLPKETQEKKRKTVKI